MRARVSRHRGDRPPEGRAARADPDDWLTGQTRIFETFEYEFVIKFCSSLIFLCFEYRGAFATFWRSFLGSGWVTAARAPRLPWRPCQAPRAEGALRFCIVSR